MGKLYKLTVNTALLPNGTYAKWNAEKNYYALYPSYSAMEKGGKTIYAEPWQIESNTAWKRIDNTCTHQFIHCGFDPEIRKIVRRCEDCGKNETQFNVPINGKEFDLPHIETEELNTDDPNTNENIKKLLDKFSNH